MLGVVHVDVDVGCQPRRHERCKVLVSLSCFLFSFSLLRGSLTDCRSRGLDYLRCLLGYSVPFEHIWNGTCLVRDTMDIYNRSTNLICLGINSSPILEFLPEFCAHHIFSQDLGNRVGFFACGQQKGTVRSCLARFS
jgi:hypothetical protein